MAKDILSLPAERETPPKPLLDDLQNISAALVGLLEDDEVPMEVDTETNVRRFSITNWLRRQGVEGAILRENPTISVPVIYFDPDQVERIAHITEVDDFPAVVLGEGEGIDLTTPQRRWQQAFLLLSVHSRSFGTRIMHLFVQQGRSRWTFSTDRRNSAHTSVWSAEGSYNPKMTEETQTVVDVLKKYGERLRSPGTQLT